MGRNISTFSVVALVVLAAGVAAASHPLLVGPSPGIALNGPTTAQATTGTATPTTGTTISTTGTTTPTTGTIPTTGTTTTTTVGPSVGTPTALQATSPTTTTSPTTPTPAGTTTTPTTTTGALAVEQIVSIARTVETGQVVSAFTVPAGRELVITDLLVTNGAATPSCTAAVSATGTTTTNGTSTTNGTTTANGTTTNGAAANGTTNGTAESGTGVLCVPAQTSLVVGLTTGLEFAAGQSVRLANTAAAGATPAGPLHYLLRGFLVNVNGV
jgi:hypothetical protein